MDIILSIFNYVKSKMIILYINLIKSMISKQTIISDQVLEIENFIYRRGVSYFDKKIIVPAEHGMEYEETVNHFIKKYNFYIVYEHYYEYECPFSERIVTKLTSKTSKFNLIIALYHSDY